MTLHEEIIKKILNEVDPDIKEMMLKEETRQGLTYKGYELFEHPALTILQWQIVRNSKIEIYGTGADN